MEDFTERRRRPRDSRRDIVADFARAFPLDVIQAVMSTDIESDFDALFSADDIAAYSPGRTTDLAEVIEILAGRRAAELGLC